MQEQKFAENGVFCSNRAPESRMAYGCQSKVNPESGFVSNITLEISVFFTIQILEIGIIFIVKSHFKGGVSQCNFRA